MKKQAEGAEDWAVVILLSAAIYRTRLVQPFRKAVREVTSGWMWISGSR
ncbi:MAG: hypothetical protein ACREFQ_10225 [Stellaceae bacterium]